MGSSKKRYSTQASRSRKGSKFSLPLVSLAVGAVLLIAIAVLFISRQDDKENEASTRQFDSSFTPEVTGAPRIEVVQDTVNHGDVKLGETVRSEFKVRNIGNQPLEILGEPQVQVLEGC